MKPYAVVIGGANMDLTACSAGKIVPGDSNPGKLRLSPGGVGRNIAQALCGLGADTVLLSAVGRDAYGQEILEQGRRQGIEMGRVLVSDALPTSCYLAVTEPDGEMLVAVSDMDICEAISPAYLREHLECINGAAAVVIEANLSAAALEFLFDNVTAPIFCDPVSTAKAGKLLPYLSNIHTLKPNILEAQQLTGLAIRDRSSIDQTVEALLAQGIKELYLSLGAKGMYCCCAARRILIPAVPTQPVSVTGAGDTAMAALVFGAMQGFSMEQSAQLAVQAAALTLSTQEAVSPQLGQLTARGAACPEADAFSR